MPTQFTEARRLLRDAKDVLIITGAGISAESGVPTFRGSGERWRNRHFSELASLRAFEQDPRLIWEWYLYRRSLVAACEPNAAHLAIADWAKSRRGVELATQNVDGLHERAGFVQPFNLHGSLWRNACLACMREREDDSLAFDAKDGLPRSPCHGYVERPAIVWFGEMLPKEEADQARAAAVMADVILVIGTSGLVPTAERLIDCAKAARAISNPFGTPSPLVVIEVNLEPSHVPCDIRLQGRAGDILPRLLER